MSQISRRRFLGLSASCILGAALSSCLGVDAPPAQPGNDASSAAIRKATPVRGQVVRNEDRPSRNVRYYRPFAPPSPEEWKLTVAGLVTTPLTLTIADIQQLPVKEQVSRMKCVEGWSFKAGWAGFDLAALLQQVGPKADAEFVHLTCADSYWEVLLVDDLLRPRVLFAYRMDGDFLPDEYGSPLRLIVPWKYGYKGAKCVTGLDLVSRSLPGYWSSVGPYSVSGDIQPGYDYPQETGERVRITEGGVELTY